LSLNRGLVGSGESTFIVEPYFFSRRSFDSGSLDYKWNADNRRLDELIKSRRITFTSDIKGRSLVSVEVSNPISLLQFAKKTFSVLSNEEE